jgi:hypothetical protein
MIIKSKTLAARQKERQIGDYSVTVDRSGTWSIILTRTGCSEWNRTEMISMPCILLFHIGKSHPET